MLVVLRRYPSGKKAQDIMRVKRGQNRPGLRQGDGIQGAVWDSRSIQSLNFLANLMTRRAVDRLTLRISAMLEMVSPASASWIRISREQRVNRM